MALSAEYQRFLAAPAVDALSANAALHYVPTLSSISEPSGILKHYETQAKSISKKSEKVLNSFESENQLCLETETTLEFLQAGGCYLPGLDDNFLVEKTVIIPIAHIVAFDGLKIRDIRLAWDQGSLLKQVDVIGRTGRNWPLNDGKDQARLIANSNACAHQRQTDAASGEEKPVQRQSRAGANGDKYTSLSLFKPHELPVRGKSIPNLIAPRESAKPPPREYSELFAGGSSNQSADATPRPPSPQKNGENLNPLKAGAGKHNIRNRLFDYEDMSTPERGIKTNPHKYSHFEIGAGGASDTESPSKQFQSKKHLSQWDFSDFVTPDKHNVKAHELSARNIGWSDDEDEARQPEQRLPHKPQPRPDASKHFEMQDNNTTPMPVKTKPAHNIGAREKAMGLYEDHVTGVDNTDSAGHTVDKSSKPLGNITNQVNHRKTFSSSFDIKDDSSPNVKDENRTENMKKAIKTNQPSWDMYDESPQAAPKDRIINIAGNGMGARAGEKPFWEF